MAAHLCRDADLIRGQFTKCGRDLGTGVLVTSGADRPETMSAGDGAGMEGVMIRSLPEPSFDNSTAVPCGNHHTPDATHVTLWLREWCISMTHRTSVSKQTGSVTCPTGRESVVKL